MGFDDHYAEIFKARWPTLREALEAPPAKIARLNPFHPDPLRHLPDDAEAEESSPDCYASRRFSPPSGEAPLPYYIMDLASVWAARALGVQPGDRVLDLCAAPGGKALILAEGLAGQGELVVNEPSRARRHRLRAVLDAYLPEKLRRAITILGRDGTRMGLQQPEGFDRVLVDAPCSSEGHVLRDPAALAQWSPARSKQLAIRQGALLAAGMDCTAPGGRLVYCTCALAPRENEEVVRRMTKKRAGMFTALKIHAPRGISCDPGHCVAPDRDGWGPLYYAVLEKRFREPHFA